MPADDVNSSTLTPAQTLGTPEHAAAREKLRKIAEEMNPPERVAAQIDKLEAALKPVDQCVNPRWQAAPYEVQWMREDGETIPDPLPFRYESVEAAERHLKTRKIQPECVPWFLTIWSDGSETETLWD